jgi:hypothetical protein
MGTQEGSTMTKSTFGIPVRTRVPLKAWVLAALVALFSLATSALHLHTTPTQSVLETLASESDFPGG